MLFSASSLARSRVQSLVASAAAGSARHGGRKNVVVQQRMAFSSQVSTSTAPPKSALNSFAAAWYNIFGSSTARYATFLAVGVIFAELITNGVTDALWEMNNRGKTYKQVDWSKFDPADDDDEDDDDDDDE